MSKEDLITAFIKHGEAEWGAAKREDNRESSDGDSCSEPSQWWGEAPNDKALDKILVANVAESRAKIDTAKTIPDGGGNAPLEQASSHASLCEPDFPDVSIEIWGGCWSRVLSKPKQPSPSAFSRHAPPYLRLRKHLCRSRGNFARRHLIIGDAMAVVLALTKGRSSSAVLLSICRQCCAYTLAADIYPHVRWVPSQRNAGDDGSRNHSRHLADSDVAEAQITLWAANKARRLIKDTKKGSDEIVGTPLPKASEERNIKSKLKPVTKVIIAEEIGGGEGSASRVQESTDAPISGLVKAIQCRLDEVSEHVAKDILCEKDKWAKAKSESKVTKANECEGAEGSASRLLEASDVLSSGSVKRIQPRIDESSEDIAKNKAIEERSRRITRRRWQQDKCRPRIWCPDFHRWVPRTCKPSPWLDAAFSGFSPLPQPDYEQNSFFATPKTGYGQDAPARHKVPQTVHRPTPPRRLELPRHERARPAPDARVKPNDAPKRQSREEQSKAYWRDPLRNLPSYVNKHNGSPVALELFSGSGRWSAAWRAAYKTRCPVFELDIRWHLRNVLLSRNVQKRIRGWVQSCMSKLRRASMDVLIGFENE